MKMSHCNPCSKSKLPPCNNLRLGSFGQQVDYRSQIFNEGPAAATNTILSVSFTGSPQFALFP